ncbi:hypothetical protein GCM10022254_70280 [Actinomadura meridiana]|uniref:Uncharacterized protein n=1 Tax=Actinomadura meridiana TaxID=559626 RepID=A0ABP8CNY4_9ACTN
MSTSRAAPNGDERRPSPAHRLKRAVSACLTKASRSSGAVGNMSVGSTPARGSCRLATHSPKPPSRFTARQTRYPPKSARNRRSSVSSCPRVSIPDLSLLIPPSDFVFSLTCQATQ